MFAMVICIVYLDLNLCDIIQLRYARNQNINFKNCFYSLYIYVCVSDGFSGFMVADPQYLIYNEDLCTATKVLYTRVLKI